MTASRMAMPTYLTGLGCECSGAWCTSPKPLGAPASSSGVAASGCSSVTSVSAIADDAPLMRVGDQVDDREDHDPHDVDEVPVQTGDLHLEVLLGRELPPQRDADEGQEPEDPDRDVDAVEAGQHEEAGRRDAGRQVQPFVGEDGELVDLAAD